MARPTFYPLADADALARRLNKENNDEEVRFLVVRVDNTTAVVETHDEDGFLEYA